MSVSRCGACLHFLNPYETSSFHLGLEEGQEVARAALCVRWLRTHTRVCTNLLSVRWHEVGTVTVLFITSGKHILERGLPEVLQEAARTVGSSKEGGVGRGIHNSVSLTVIKF